MAATETGPEYFSFAESLGPESIRLVRIRPRSVLQVLCLRPIQLDIAVFPLRDVPPYRALSYTWGPPHVDMTAYTEHDKRDIRISGRRFAVLPNLLDALLELEVTLRGPKWRKGPHYLWIDAICINQSDMAERAVQVGIMDRVYSQATQTIVWLGKQDHHAFQARAVFNTILRIPAREINSAHDRGEWPSLPAFAAWGLPELDPAVSPKWQAIFAVLRRAWFTRSWVVQEILLSRDIQVLCGDWAFPFIDLIYVASFLEDTHIYDGAYDTTRISGSGRTQMIIDPTGPLLTLWSMWVMCHPEANVGIRLRESASRTLEVMMRFGGGTKELGPARVLLYFAHFLSTSKCTDPRDRVFSFMGITKVLMELYNSGPAWGVAGRSDCVAIRYTPGVTAAMVFEELVAAFLAQTKSLGFLALLSDYPGVGPPGLPSWVPNFWEGPDNLSLLWVHFNASGYTEGHRQPSFAISDHHLRVNASVLCKVKTLSLHLPHTIGLNFGEETWMNDLLSTERIYRFTGEGRIQAFWRTLLADSNVDQGKLVYPASWHGFKNGEPFSSFILLHTLNLSSHKDTSKGGRKAEELNSSTLACLDALAESDPAGHLPHSTHLKEGKTRKLRIDDGNCTDPQGDLDWLTNTSKAALLFLRALDRSMPRRRFAISKQGYFLLAPEWTEPDDEILIVHGCPCPLVVRRTGEFATVVGAAYVHGVMRGETVTNDTRWEPVTFV